MNPENTLLRKQIVRREYSFPAKIFAYLGLCRQYRTNVLGNVEKKVNSCNLPLISSLSSRFTPLGLIHARLSFLKYCCNRKDAV